jgi:hypothetical protein
MYNQCDSFMSFVAFLLLHLLLYEFIRRCTIQKKCNTARPSYLAYGNTTTRPTTFLKSASRAYQCCDLRQNKILFFNYSCIPQLWAWSFIWSVRRWLNMQSCQENIGIASTEVSLPLVLESSRSINWFVVSFSYSQNFVKDLLI